MGIQVMCDWCRDQIPPGQPYVTVAIDGKVSGAKKLRDVSERPRVYCGFRWKGEAQSCAERMLTALGGVPDGRVDAGLEWRLVPLGAEFVQPAPTREEPETPRPAPQIADGGSYEFTFRAWESGGRGEYTDTVVFDPGMYGFLMSMENSKRAGIARSGLAGLTLQQAAAMSEDELMRLERVGLITVRRFRAYLGDQRTPEEHARDCWRSVLQTLKDTLRKPLPDGELALVMEASEHVAGVAQRSSCLQGVTA